LETISRETLKYILREGARANNILRLTDDCFENMVDILGLPLDREVHTSAWAYKEENADDDVLKVEAKDQLDKSFVNNPQTISSCMEEKISANMLIQAKEILNKIYAIEREIFYLDKEGEAHLKKTKQKTVMPINVDPEKLKELKYLKESFK